MTSEYPNPPEPPQIGRRVDDTQPIQGGGSARRTADARGFSSALGWTVLGTIFPGLGLIRSGRRVIGSIVLGIWVVLIGGVVGVGVVNLKLLARLALDTNTLNAVAIVLVSIAVIWVAVIGFSHLALRPAKSSVGQRAAGAAIVGVLSFLVAAPLALGANFAVTTASGLSVFDGSNEQSITTPTINADNPWANKKRLNILILGGDSGTGRDISLGIRPDSVIVVSIDTSTGATSMFNLPRQTAKMPFPKSSPLHKYFPNGFYDGVSGLNQEYALNAMYNNIPHLVPKKILGNAKTLSTDAMKISVGEALGLKIDYYVLVNMDGFKDIINAIGGITVNVNDRIPMGGHNASGTKAEAKPFGWIEIGPNQHLMGMKALWFARGRYHTTDYKRMARQRCVINAVAQQANPATVLANYQSLVAAGTKTIKTDVPTKLLPDLAELAVKIKNQSIRSILLNQSVGFKSWDPNWTLVRKLVAATLKEADANAGSATATASASASASATASATTSASASATPSSTTKAKEKSDDLADSCAYHPSKK